MNLELRVLFVSPKNEDLFGVIDALEAEAAVSNLEVAHSVSEVKKHWNRPQNFREPFNSPKIYLIDLEMPEALNIVQFLRSRSISSTLFVIGLGENLPGSFLDRAHEAGLNAYFDKSFGFGGLGELAINMEAVHNN